MGLIVAGLSNIGAAVVAFVTALCVKKAISKPYKTEDQEYVEDADTWRL